MEGDIAFATYRQSSVEEEDAALLRKGSGVCFSLSCFGLGLSLQVWGRGSATN